MVSGAAGMVRSPVLVGPFARLMHVRFGPGSFGCGLFLRRFALRPGLVLLGLTFTDLRVVPRDRSGRFLEPALDVHDDALDALGWATPVRHRSHSSRLESGTHLDYPTG